MSGDVVVPCNGTMDIGSITKILNGKNEQKYIHQEYLNTNAVKFSYNDNLHWIRGVDNNTAKLKFDCTFMNRLNYLFNLMMNVLMLPLKRRYNWSETHWITCIQDSGILLCILFILNVNMLPSLANSMKYR